MNPYSPGNQPAGYEAWQDAPDKPVSLSILALASLILSVLCVTAPLGLICGIAALFTISASGGRKSGRGLAIAGVIIGLLFSSLLVFGAIGANSAAQFVYQQMAPAGTLVESVEAKDFVKARTGMLAASGAAITDADLDAFRTAYQADLGAYKGMPQSMLALIRSYSLTNPALQTMQRSQRGRGDLIPVAAEFANGWAIIGMQIDPSAQPKSGQMTLQIRNICIFSNDGKTYWLKDPSTVAADSPFAPMPGGPVKIKIGPPGSDPDAEPDPAPAKETGSGG